MSRLLSTIPCCRIERKKVNGCVFSGDDGLKQSDTEAPIPTGTSSSSSSSSTTNRPTTSFIPTLSEAELMESGRSHRLSSLPDPSQIGKTTLSVDDLKRRIYGKQFTPTQPSLSSPTTSASSQDNAQVR